MKKLLFLLIVIISVTLSFKTLNWTANCEKEEGKISRTTIDVKAFNKLVLNGSHTVYLTQSDQHKVEIETTENIKKLLSTSVSDEEWKISFEKCLKTKNGVYFYISTPNIESLTVNGSGDIIGKSTIKSSELSLNVRGSGDIKVEIESNSTSSSVIGSGDIVIEGSTVSQSATVKGSGDISASGLKSETAEASVSGSGDINIMASKTLNAKVNGSGDIVYSGQPENVSKQVNGSGDIEEK